MGDRRAGKGRSVNLNAASRSELMALPGMDAKRAGRLIRERRNRGDFKTAEEVDSVARDENWAESLGEAVEIKKRPSRG